MALRTYHRYHKLGAVNLGNPAAVSFKTPKEHQNTHRAATDTESVRKDVVSISNIIGRQPTGN
jgi:hypothetical protein